MTAASAATGVTTAGSALSTATIATVAVGSMTVGATTITGHTVSIGTLSADAQTLTSQAPAVTFTPLTVDGTQPAGSTTVTPANSPKSVGAVTTGALPLNILAATSPAATLKAASAPSPTSTLSASLGSVQILGLPVTLNGSLSVGSVTDSAHAQAGKALAFSNISLPSVADFLGALGLDLAKLPAATLNGLLTQLPVTVSSTTQAAVDAANTAIGNAQTALTAAQGDLATAQSNYDTAAAALDSALATADYTGSGVTGPIDHAQWDALSGATQTIITTLNSSVATAASAYDATKAPLDTAQTAVTNATNALASAISTLAGLVNAVLDGTPLVSIGAAEVATKAAVGASKVATVTGYVSGVKVLGQDVLSTVTGDTKLDVAKMAGDVATDVNAAIKTATTSLSSVLSSATGAIGLTVPAPTIQVLTKSVSTGTEGLFGVANTVVTALNVSMGSVTLPTAYALDNAASLAGIAPTATGFKTAPLAVKVGTLVEGARFRKASTTGGGAQMPATGMPYGLGVTALASLAVAVAVVVGRRLRTFG